MENVVFLREVLQMDLRTPTVTQLSFGHDMSEYRRINLRRSMPPVDGLAPLVNRSHGLSLCTDWLSSVFPSDDVNKLSIKPGRSTPNITTKQENNIIIE